MIITMSGLLTAVIFSVCFLFVTWSGIGTLYLSEQLITKAPKAIYKHMTEIKLRKKHNLHYSLLTKKHFQYVKDDIWRESWEKKFSFRKHW